MAKNKQKIVILILMLFALSIITPKGLIESYKKVIIDDILFFIVAGLPIALVAAIFIFIIGGEKPKSKD